MRGFLIDHGENYFQRNQTRNFASSPGRSARPDGFLGHAAFVRRKGLFTAEGPRDFGHAWSLTEFAGKGSSRIEIKVQDAMINGRSRS